MSLTKRQFIAGSAALTGTMAYWSVSAQGKPLPITAAHSVNTKLDGTRIEFQIDPYRRHCLLNGLDEIAETMTHEATISAYERKLAHERSWHQPAG